MTKETNIYNSNISPCRMVFACIIVLESFKSILNFQMHTVLHFITISDLVDSNLELSINRR